MALANAVTGTLSEAGSAEVTAADTAADKIAFSQVASSESKPLLIVLTGDPDDEQSMVRLLTYSNEFRIEGLIAGSHLVADRGPSPHLIERIVDQYEDVRDNLLLHAGGFPTADELRSKVAGGQRHRGAFGSGLDTPGSNLIINVVDSPDPNPVNIAIWGDSADLAQALWRIRAERTEAEVAAFVSKLRISWIEQDTSADWIKSNFPDLWIVSHLAPQNPFQDAPFRGMYLGGDQRLSSKEWVEENVKPQRPWGDLYPSVASGGAMKEGD